MAEARYDRIRDRARRLKAAVNAVQRSEQMAALELSPLKLEPRP
jgi:hypothetical protein